MQERDAEIHEVRLAMKKLKGKIETLEVSLNSVYPHLLE